METELNLYDYWQIIKKRRAIAIGILLLVVVSTLIFTFLSTKIYNSSTTVELRIEGPSSWAFGSFAQGLSWMVDIDTEIRKVTSYPVLLRSAKILGLIDENPTEQSRASASNSIRGKISVTKIPNTTLINIIANDTEPQKAVEIANAVAQAYLDETIETRNERAKKTREFIEQQVSTISDDLKEKEQKIRQYVATGMVSEKIQSMGGNLTDLLIEESNLLTQYGEKHPEVIKIRNKINVLKSKLGKMSHPELEYITLLRDVKIDVGLYEMLITKHREALITEADKVVPVAIVEPARNAVLVKPDRRMNMLMGLLVGLMFATIGVVLAESLDTSLRTAEEIETYLKLPTFAEIPHIRDEKSDTSPFLLLSDSHSPYVESYNEFLANFNRYDPEKKIQTLLFTSVMPSEGKSEVISNFAILQSQNNNKTLVIDADFRQAAIHKLFKVPRKPGVMDIIKENLNWRDVVKKPVESGSSSMVSLPDKTEFNLANLSILSVGHLPAHPMQVIGSSGFTELVMELKKEFDYILFDSPPLYYFADPTVISSLCDGIILVHTPKTASRDELKRAKKRLSPKLIGVVLNNMEEKRRGYYYYKYYSGKKDLSLKEKMLKWLGI